MRSSPLGSTATQRSAGATDARVCPAGTKLRTCSNPRSAAGKPLYWRTRSSRSDSIRDARRFPPGSLSARTAANGSPRSGCAASASTRAPPSAGCPSHAATSRALASITACTLPASPGAACTGSTEAIISTPVVTTDIQVPFVFIVFPGRRRLPSTDGFHAQRARRTAQCMAPDLTRRCQGDPVRLSQFVSHAAISDTGA
ncbi:hypothetical protein D3C71_1252060 [compost metagenome]